MRLDSLLALARKELAQLAPLWVTLACLHLLELVFFHLLSARPMRSWGELSWLSQAGSDTTGWRILLLATITAYNLMPGEHAQGTIRFLYTLPLHRRWVFFTKAAVGAAILILHNAVRGIMGGLVILGSQDSFIREQATVGILVVEFTLESAFALFCLCYGLFLSFFRRLGWLLVAVALIAVAALPSLDPRLAILNPLSLFEIGHHGTRPIIPWRNWALHGGLSLVAFIVAGALWLHGEERFAAIRHRFATGTRLRKFGFGLAALAVAFISGVAFKAWETVGAASGRGLGSEEALAILETTHYRFSYRRADEAKARALALEADDAYERVRRWLGKDIEARIVVDLTYDGIEHAGLTSATKIRMDLGAPGALRRRALQHETIHVLSNVLSEGTPEGVGPRGRFLAEAIAEYGEHELAPDPARRHRTRLLASLGRSRFKIEFHALLDAEAFLAVHDEFLLYALGEVWVAALVQTCGRDAPARLVAGFAAPGLPRNAEPIEQWRHVMQKLGCGLDLVRGRYEDMLARLETEARQLPITRARFVGFEGPQETGEAHNQTDPGEVADDEEAGAPLGLIFEVEVEGKGSSSWLVLIKVREKPGTPLHQIGVAELRLGEDEQARVTVPGPSIWADGFEFQVGAAGEPQGQPFYSRWQTVVPQEGRARR